MLKNWIRMKTARSPNIVTDMLR